MTGVSRDSVDHVGVVETIDRNQFHSTQIIMD